MIRPLIAHMYLHPYNRFSLQKQLIKKKNTVTSLFTTYTYTDNRDLYSKLEHLNKIEYDKVYKNTIEKLDKLYGQDLYCILLRLSRDSIDELEWIRTIYCKPRELSDESKISVRKHIMRLMKKEQDIETKFWVKVLDYYGCL